MDTIYFINFNFITITTFLILKKNDISNQSLKISNSINEIITSLNSINNSEIKPMTNNLNQYITEIQNKLDPDMINKAIDELILLMVLYETTNSENPSFLLSNIICILYGMYKGQQFKDSGVVKPFALGFPKNIVIGIGVDKPGTGATGVMIFKLIVVS